MDLPVVLRNREIGEKEISLIQSLIKQEGQKGRSYIAARLCRIWNWKQANGHYREIACRDVLRRLDQKSLIQLPPMLRPARAKGYKNKTQIPCDLDTSLLDQPIKSLRPSLLCQQVKGTSKEADFNGLIGAYHYLGYQQATGAQLKYIFYLNERMIGCASFGPAAWKVAARDQHIGWSAPLRQQNLSLIVNNDRFLILSWIRIKSLASCLMAKCLRTLPKDWKRIYGHRIVLAETFVEKSRFIGTCYKAANWKCLGQTKGRGRNDQFNKGCQPIKTVWIYPLNSEYKQRLNWTGNLNI